jgi:amidase
VSNYVDMGIGADQGGSIRIPAAMSGCVGLKPTHGLVSYTGVVSSEAVMDYVGPICKNVMDAAILLEVIAGRDGLDDRAVGAQRHGEIKYSSDLNTWYEGREKEGKEGVLKGFKIGILKEAMETEAVHPEYRKKVSSSAYKLRELGAIVEEVSMPSHVTGRDIWIAIRRLGASLVLAGKASGRKHYTLTTFLDKLVPMTQDKWDRTPPAVKSTIINGGYALEKYPTLYHKCLNLAVQRKWPPQTKPDIPNLSLIDRYFSFEGVRSTALRIRRPHHTNCIKHSAETRTSRSGVIGAVES